MLALSSDDTRFATAASNCDIALWDALTGAHIMTLVHSGTTSALEFLFGSAHLTSGDTEGVISLWDVVTGACTRTFKGHSERITSLSSSPTRPQLASASDDKTVRVWDSKSWEILYSVDYDSQVKSVVFYPDGIRLAAGTATEDMDNGDGILQVLDTITRQRLTTYNLASNAHDVAVSRDGKWLTVVTQKGLSSSVSMFNASSIDRIWSYDYTSCSVSFSTNISSSQLASSDGSYIWLWNIQTGDRVDSFQHGGASKVTFSPSGAWFISSERDLVTEQLRFLMHPTVSERGTCRLWDPNLPWEDELEANDKVDDLKFSKDGSLLAIKRRENIEMRTVSPWKRIWSAPCTSSLNSGDNIDFSPDGLRVAFNCGGSAKGTYDVRSGNKLSDEFDFGFGSMYDHVHKRSGVEVS